MRIALTIILVCFISVFLSGCKPNELSGKKETITLMYAGWACDCAQWITLEDAERYSGQLDTLGERSIYLEPASRDLELPDTLFNENIMSLRLKLTGEFYKEKGFPEDFYSPQDPEAARVFRYTKYEVLYSE